METTKSTYCSCLYYSANALSRVMTKMAEEEFTSCGFAPSYAFLLMTVNETPGIQPKNLSIQMQLTPSTVTRLIEKMEYKGFLERKSVGRATQVFPLEKSLALQKELKACWKNLFERYTTLLGKEQAIELTQNVYAAYEKLEN